MKERLCLILFIIPLSLQVFSQEIKPGLQDVSVTSLNNKEVRFEVPDKRIFVIVTLGTDCPISQKYIPVIKALQESFGKEVEMIGLFPSYFSVEEIRTFKSEYAIEFQCFIDHDMGLINLLQATVTPEVFLFDTDLQCQYSGAIDNWFYDLGRYRTEVTRHYLKDAIEAMRYGASVQTKRTEAIGCLIEHNKESAEPRHVHH